MTDHGFYPTVIDLVLSHDDAVPALALARAYARAFHDAGCGDVVRYADPATGGEDTAGTLGELEAALDALGPDDAHFFAMVMRDGTSLTFSRGTGGRPTWSADARAPVRPPTLAWMTAMADIAVAAAALPGFRHAVLRRQQQSWYTFVPEPPLARTHHVVTTTEREVAACYDQPDVFWKCWDRVETAGEIKICIRALEELDDEFWLGATFSASMWLARCARPQLTYYNAPSWDPAFRPWWSFGDPLAEAGGYPALAVAGYDAATRTLEYTGGVVDKPVTELREPEAQHVHVREIHALRALAKAKKDAQGRPVETLRVVFPEAWMALQERRPLIDAGAHVFYTGAAGELVSVVDVAEPLAPSRHIAMTRTLK